MELLHLFFFDYMDFFSKLHGFFFQTTWIFLSLELLHLKHQKLHPAGFSQHEHTTKNAHEFGCNELNIRQTALCKQPKITL